MSDQVVYPFEFFRVFLPIAAAVPIRKALTALDIALAKGEREYPPNHIYMLLHTLEETGQKPSYSSVAAAGWVKGLVHACGGGGRPVLDYSSFVRSPVHLCVCLYARPSRLDSRARFFR